jgi:hypothetical protein
MNFYTSSVALLWTTAMRLGNPRTGTGEAVGAERAAASGRLMPCERGPAVSATLRCESMVDKIVY